MMANFFTPAHMSPFHSKQSKQRKQERDLLNLLRSKQRKEAEFEAREVARYDTWEYLDQFVKMSPEWCQLNDQITICWENLPPLDELLSYGALDKTSGTLKCRKLFKAAVIWEDLGCSLWEELSRQSPSNRGARHHESSLSTVHEQGQMSSGSSRASSTERGESSDRPHLQSSTYCYSLRSPARPPTRSRSMPMPEEKDSLHGIPRFFTTHRSNSVKAV